MLKKLSMMAALATIAASALAVDMSMVDQSIPLKDGSTVYIFKDGKMGMENKFGRPVRMKQHEVMETKDGQKIMMHGDEVMRVELLRREQGLKGQG